MNIIDTIKQLLAENQFASGGVFLAALSGVLLYLRRVPQFIWQQLRRLFLLEIEVYDSDPAFHDIYLWLIKNKYGAKTKKIWLTSSNRITDKIDKSGWDELWSTRTVPGIGRHFVWFKHRLMYINIFKRDLTAGEDTIGIRRHFVIQIPFGSRKILDCFLREIETLRAKDQNLYIKVPDSYFGGWNDMVHRNIRKLSYLVYQDSLIEQIIADIDKFKSSAEWYANRGIPYKRGYLLHGPPGNGKTSLVSAIAGHYRYNIYTINLAAKDLSDDKLMGLMACVPSNSIVLFEDIDCLLANREVKNKNDGLTFKGLLNAIDGIVSLYGVLLFVTTNHADTLDPALVRAGRLDKHYLVGNADKEQIMRLCKVWNPNWDDLKVAAFTEAQPEGCSMAYIQEQLIVAEPQEKI